MLPGILINDHSEKVADFAGSLKKLYKSAYPGEAITSTVLLQRFLTGLCPEIAHQLLLRNRPTDFTAALKDAIEIEYALEFDNQDDTINAIGRTAQKTTPTPDASLRQTLETLTKRLDSLEATMQKTHKAQPISYSSKERGGYGNRQGQRRSCRDRQVGPCYNCGAFGHICHNFPLNSYGPAPPVEASWTRHH